MTFVKRNLSKFMTSVLITGVLTISQTEAAVKQDIVWNLGKSSVISSGYNAVWSIYMAGNMQDMNDSSDEWSKFDLWQKYLPEENINNLTNGVQIVRGKSELDIYSSKSGGRFSWKPASCAESDGKGTAVIGWTASESGTYIVETGGYNKGINGVKSTEATNHKIVSRKAGENNLTLLDEFSIYSASDGREYVLEKKYTLEAGETIYLMNDAGTDGYGDDLDIKFNVTKADEPQKIWRASDMYRQKIKDSPFRLWFVQHDNPKLSDYYAADLIAENNGLSACKGISVGSSYITTDGNGYFYAAPDEDDTLGGNLGVSFDVADDGFYDVDFSVRNIVGEGDDYAENSQAKLYYITGHDEIFGEPLEKIEEIDEGTSSFSHRLYAGKGDKILLNIEADYDSYGINLKGTYKITKLKTLSCVYRLNGNEITFASELSGGGILTENVDYLAEKSGNTVIISAVYNSEGKMIDVGVSDAVAAEKGSIYAVTLNMNIPTDENAVKIKTFAFNNTALPNPFTEVEILE